MPNETTDVVIVGAGQAGLAMSEHLLERGIPHIVLERDRIAEAWRTKRWDSLVANGPAWHDRFPSKRFEGMSPDAFAGKDAVADYFEDFAAENALPVRTAVEVLRAARRPGERGYRVETSEGVIDADCVVAATGPFQHATIPALVDDAAGVAQLHSSDYRNPEQLAPGAVLVVGAGSSGVQIAAELREAGREVFLAVGPHDRPPRSYRGRDFVWWLGVLGLWDLAAPAPGTEHVTIAVSGAHGGRTVDFRDLAASGITLLGRAEACEGTTMRFAPDLARNITNGDANYLSLLNAADAYVARTGIDLPEEPEAHRLAPLPREVTDPILELDLAAAGITTIIWATGFRLDYEWFEIDAFDERGRPVHQRGVSPVEGAYFLGLPWQSRRGSSFIWGVWHDAKFIADQIGIQRAYRDYRPAEEPAAAAIPAPEAPDAPAEAPALAS